MARVLNLSLFHNSDLSVPPREYNDPKYLPWGRKMTLCIAAMAEDRRSLVIAADKMISTGFIEAELQIEKITRLDERWWVMFAGTVPYVFDLVDYARNKLKDSGAIDVDQVADVLVQAYRWKRLKIAESMLLSSRGWTLERFQQEGRTSLGDSYFQALDGQIAAFEMDLQLLVAGFDPQGVAHIFTVENPGQAGRREIPGYHAIGNGMFGALYFLYYREMNTKMTVTEALYHVFEAKIFGYQAGSIGEETDFIVVRPRQEPIYLRESNVRLNKALNKLWTQFRPQPVKGLMGALNRFVKPVVSSSGENRGTQPPQPEAQ